MSYSKLDWDCNGRTIALTSNQHFYQVCNDTYKDSYLSIGESSCPVISIQKDPRLSENQLNLLEQKNSEENKEQDMYSYAREKGYLIHKNKKIHR